MLTVSDTGAIVASGITKANKLMYLTYRYMSMEPLGLRDSECQTYLYSLPMDRM